MKNSHALVVLSGGQDSMTCLFWALHQYKKVTAITFDYGQRHQTEINQAKMICRDFQIDHHIVDMQHIGEVSVSALLEKTTNVNAEHVQNSELPASFVPNRNAMFLTTAHALAQTIGAGHLVTGVCQTDYSGYPDCRDVFIKSLNVTLNLGSSTDIQIHTPLMWLDKAETFRLAETLNKLDYVVQHSHTCYEGDRTQLHDWGYGCGKCGACEVRRNGWEVFAETRR